MNTYNTIKFIIRCISLIFTTALDVYTVYYIIHTWHQFIDLPKAGYSYAALSIAIKWVMLAWMLGTIIFFSLLTCFSKHFHYWQHIPFLRIIYFKSILEDKVDNNIISALYLILYGAVNVFFTFIAMMNAKQVYKAGKDDLIVAIVSFVIAVIVFVFNTIPVMWYSIRYHNDKKKRMKQQELMN